MSHPQPTISDVGVQFKLKPHHRNIPDGQLLADLQRIAAHLGVSTMTQAMYRQHSRFNPLTICKRFGGWNAALAAAKLKPSRHFRVCKKAVLNDVRRVARKLKTQKLLLAQYQAEGKYSPVLIYKHFGSWTGVLKEAGLAASAYHPRATDQALLENLEQVWRRLGRQPACTDLFPPLSSFGLTPYQRRFGGYQNALIAFANYMAARAGKVADTVPHAAPVVPHKTSRSINWRLRFVTLRRDQFKCQACGRSPATDPNIELEVDHKIPWSKGGETVLETPANIVRDVQWREIEFAVASPVKPRPVVAPSRSACGVVRRKSLIRDNVPCAIHNQPSRRAPARPLVAALQGNPATR